MQQLRANACYPDVLRLRTECAKSTLFRISVTTFYILYTYIIDPQIDCEPHVLRSVQKHNMCCILQRIILQHTGV